MVLYQIHPAGLGQYQRTGRGRGAIRPCCGTALGALERNAALLERRRRSDERKEASLRRKGWGEPRIQRWRNQQQKVSSGHDPQAGLIDWERLLTDLLIQPRKPYVGLLLHWYGGGFDEPIALQGRVSLPLCA